MKMFEKALLEELNKSINNNFGADNHDGLRFGLSEFQVHSFLDSLKIKVKRFLNYRSTGTKKIILDKLKGFEKYFGGFQFLFEHISRQDQELIVKLIAFRILGSKRVKLPTNNKRYWDALSVAKGLGNSNDTYDPHFMHFVLERFNLSPIGYDLELYFSSLGIAIDFITEQYAYKSNGKTIVSAGEGDVVLDVGACWGDTALYFASKVGSSGKVFSFEFIPDNIRLFNLNKSLNPTMEARIHLVQNPVSSYSDEIIFFKDHGPGSRIEKEPFHDQTGSTTTISIDDFVMLNKIAKVDFIKMDIEGAEPAALRGAIETIKKFRPKLAIAIYHSLDDFVNIPRWILDLNLGYELFIGHFTIHAEETICFAKPKSY